MICKYIYKGITYKSKEDFIKNVIKPYFLNDTSEFNSQLNELRQSLNNFKEEYSKNNNLELKNQIDNFEKSIKEGEKQLSFVNNLKLNTKTRRILEVQSDLFQKGRDRNRLTNKEYKTLLDDILLNVDNYKLDNGFYHIIDVNNGIDVFGTTKEIFIEKAKKEINNESNQNRLKENNTLNKQNQFLQLLNKDNNWVTFFVKSIIQDSAKQTITEVQESDVEAKVKELEKEGLLEIDCSKIKAKDGIRSKFTKGSRWEIVKDLKGYPFHAQGGVDIKLGKDGFSFNSNGNDIKAAHGLVLPKIK